MRARRSIGLMALSLLCSGSVAAASSFQDVSGHPHALSISALITKGIVSGYDDGTFRPEVTVNRAELLKILVRSAGVTPASDDRNCFPDVAGEWFAPYVCRAKKLGWVKGYEDGTFQPARPVRAAEALKMMMNAFGYTPSRSTLPAPLAGVDPSSWYSPYVSLAIDQNIVQFTGAFDPARDMSRGDISDMVYRCILKRQADTARSSTSSDAATSSKATVRPARHGGGNAVAAGSTDGGTGGGGTGGQNSLLTPSIVFGNITKQFGNADFILAPTSDSAGAFTYDSSNTAVATVSSSTVTIVGVGSTVITATQAANGSYAGATKTATLTVSAIAPTITFNAITKQFGDASFSLSPISDSAGAFSYTSSDTNVATVAGSTVTIVAAGTTTITLSQAANGNYTSGSATATLTVSTVAPTLGGFGNITKQMGDIPFSLTAPTSNSAGVFTYMSSDTNVATISGNTVTLVSNGSVTITATQAANGNYTSGTKTLTLTVVVGECFTAPCENGGTCTNGPGGTFSCSCTAGYSGTLCELNDFGCNYDYGNFPCLNGGTCVPDIMGGYCQCTADFCGQQCSVLDVVGPADGQC